jgi:transposase
MKYVGIDLHKHLIQCCVVGPHRKVLGEKKLYCDSPDEIRCYFGSLGKFEVVIEATAAYDWLAELLEPMAERVVLAHPGKMRIIAESKKKTDRVDARLLAEFLALGYIPQAYRPTPREREMRTLARHRQSLKQQRTRVCCKIRSLLARYNLDRKGLFGREGRQYLHEVKLSATDRFVLDQDLRQLEHQEALLLELKKQMNQFHCQGSDQEKKDRKLMLSVVGVGETTASILQAELGSDLSRFPSQKEVAAYAGLVPGRRESAGKAKDLPITKQGSRLLRWGMIQAAWVAVRWSRKWSAVHQQLSKRRGKKRSIIAVARRLLCTVAAVVKNQTPYDEGYDLRKALEQKRKQEKDQRQGGDGRRSSRRGPQARRPGR